MNKIIRVWAYKATDVKEHQADDCKHFVKDVLRGDFEYYETDGQTVRKAKRKDAAAFEAKTGEKVELVVGYPSFMHDLGYRL